MPDLQRASARWQHRDGKGMSSGTAPKAARTLASPVHAIDGEADVALCGAKVPVSSGEAWRVTPGTCPRCADLAKKA